MTQEKEAVLRKVHLETRSQMSSKDISPSKEPSTLWPGPLLAGVCRPGFITANPLAPIFQFGWHVLWSSWPCLTGSHTLQALAPTPPQRGFSHRL